MKIQLPSLDYLFDKVWTSFLRFPLTIMAGLLAACIQIYLIESEGDLYNNLQTVNLLCASGLGIPLFFCSSILAEAHDFKLELKLASHAIAAGLLVLVYFSLPDPATTNYIALPYIRFTIFVLAAHALAAFIPYLKNQSINGFWNYNKTLFIRILTAIFYSFTLYFGLCLSLVALDLLFEVKVRDELYLELLVAVFGLFNTWFFVAGIPKDLPFLDDLRAYPKGLKIFTQYVLVPLLLLYLVILYAYTSKIILSWDWPKGIVTYLIICISVLGILTFLLIYPYGNLKENTWIKKFTNWYYYTLFPLVGVLFIAIWFRIDTYGVTINRYLIILLGIWLLVVAVYFTVGKKNIKFIPISLFVILVLMSFGPWGIFEVSENSQTERFKSILENSQILEDGKVKNEVVWKRGNLFNPDSKKEYANANLVNDSIHREIKSILRYLHDYHGFSSLRPLFRQNVDSVTKIALQQQRENDTVYAYINEVEIYMNTLGLKDYRSSPGYTTYTSTAPNLVSVRGYDYAIEFDRYGRKTDKFTIEDLDYVMSYDYATAKNILQLQSDPEIIDLDLNPLLNSLKQLAGSNSANIPPSKMSFKSESKHFEIKIQLNRIIVENTKLESVDGLLLLKKKPETEPK